MYRGYVTSTAGPEPDPEIEAMVRAAMEDLTEVGRPLGLHFEKGSAAVAPPGDPRPTLIVATFAVGDLAFTDRVLDPQSEDEEKVLRNLRADDALDQFNEVIRRHRAGESPLDDLAQDDG